MAHTLRREFTQDLSSEPLGPVWLQRSATGDVGKVEALGAGVFCAGSELQFRNELVGAIDDASEVVLLCSFLLSDKALGQAMIRAAKRGVRVYALTASEEQITKLTRAGREVSDEKRATEHRLLLDELAASVLLRTGPFHAKFVVVDPGLSGARAWISTANFNKALADGLELAVELDADGALELYHCFRWAFWCEADRELSGPGRLVEVRPPPSRPPSPVARSVAVTCREGTSLRDRLLATIRGATKELLVATYAIDPSHPTVIAIAESARRGVPVTILTRPRPQVAAGVAFLSAAGAKVLAQERLHAKALVADGQAFVFTANLEPLGLDDGFDVGATLAPHQARLVDERLRIWASEFPWEFRSDAIRGSHLGEYLPANQPAGCPRGSVVAEQLVELPPVVIRPPGSIETAPTPNLVAPDQPGIVPRRIRFTWEVRGTEAP